jgi:hypothetical protein
VPDERLCIVQTQQERVEKLAIIFTLDSNFQNNKNLFWDKYLIVVQEDAVGSLADLGTQVKLLK